MSALFAQPEPNPICIGCHKPPAEIREFIMLGAEENLTPAEYVQQNEATFNHTNGHFACTACYADLGYPSSSEGWIAE